MPEFKFECASCGISLSVEDEKIPESLICPKCGTPLGYISPSGILTGTRIGTTILTHFIKSSDCGELWFGEQGEFRRKVIVKLLPHELSKDEELLKRFAREAKNIAKLDHPNITKWINYGNSQGLYYIITAYIEHGLSLKEYLDEVSDIPERKALKVVYKVADALDYAWKKHTLVHRNIKPSKILVDGSLIHVQLIDFSLSKMMHEDVTLTMIGTRVGTCGYMSQELLKGRFDIDCRADIYSLGITLFYMLAGRIPFDGATADEIIAAQINQQCHPITDFRSNLSAGCINILNKMTAFSREDRYQDWDALKLDIARLLSSNKTRKTEPTSTVIEIQPPPPDLVMAKAKASSPKMKKRQIVDVTASGSFIINDEPLIPRSIIIVFLVVVGLSSIFGIFMFRKHSEFKKQHAIEIAAKIEQQKKVEEQVRIEEKKAEESRDTVRQGLLANTYEETMMHARHLMKKEENPELVVLYLKKAKKPLAGTEYETRIDEKIKQLSGFSIGAVPDNIFEILRSNPPKERVPELE